MADFKTQHHFPRKFEKSEEVMWVGKTKERAGKAEKKRSLLSHTNYPIHQESQ